MSREALPPARGSLNLDFVYPPENPAGGLQFTATVGFYEDGRMGELFLMSGKAESTMESIARDLAVVTSIALQYGAPVDVIRAALTQLSNGAPAGPLGVLFELLKRP